MSKHKIRPAQQQLNSPLPPNGPNSSAPGNNNPDGRFLSSMLVAVLLAISIFLFYQSRQVQPPLMVVVTAAPINQQAISPTLVVATVADQQVESTLLAVPTIVYSSLQSEYIKKHGMVKPCESAAECEQMRIYNDDGSLVNGTVFPTGEIKIVDPENYNEFQKKVATDWANGTLPE